MKVRIGFVSNSSSSSFVIFGYDISKNKSALKKIKALAKGDEDIEEDDYELESLIEENTKIDDIVYRVGYGAESGLNGGEIVLGILIAEFSDDGGDYSNEKISLTDLQKKLEKIKEQFDICEEFTIFKGTRAC